MKTKTTKNLISLYLRIARYFGRRLRLPKASRKYFDLSMKDFSDLINKFEYRKDPLNGAIDYISHPDKFFYENKKVGRDCDDWGRLWALWGLYNGYRAFEYVVCDPSTVKQTFATLHCVTLLQKDNKYYLMNYTPYGPFSSEERALEILKYSRSYSNNILVVLDREVTLS